MFFSARFSEKLFLVLLSGIPKNRFSTFLCLDYMSGTLDEESKNEDERAVFFTKRGFSALITLSIPIILGLKCKR